MTSSETQKTAFNVIGGEQVAAQSGETIDKYSPVTGEVICRVPKSDKRDVQRAIESARSAQTSWAQTPAGKRGETLYDFADRLKARQEEVAKIVALETGKSPKEAFGEVGGAIALGRFMAGEGNRFYGKSTVSGQPNRLPYTIREPLGVVGLITAANTPIANVAWKTFPALICGNAALLKSSEDSPLTSLIFTQIAHETNLPKGVLNLIQGLGPEAGAPIVESPEVSLISFTGSSEVGKYIARVAGERMARVCLELGGKNPLVVCDDADLDNAVQWTVLSAFSNAGQRCASGSRIIIFDSVYEQFKSQLLEKTSQLRVGPTDQDDLGPVINEKQLKRMVAIVESAVQSGGKVVAGGGRLEEGAYRRGCYMAPTILEGIGPRDTISTEELFGPITMLYRVKGYSEALELANDSPYGLTASIHTRNFTRANHFCRNVQSGVAVVNAGTYGSEPHMPFGGVKLSGNGWREPGSEAMDVYSNMKTVYHVIDPNQL